jgi:adenylate kinase family enzyme
MELPELGERICILGPSNSGKSTLAAAIARKCNLPAIHLDQFHHLPNTDWQPRPTSEFVALHDTAIAGDRWVMDGNYSQCMPQRLRRATGVILLDISAPASLLRYFRRTLFGRRRIGALEGGQDSIKWLMIRHISVVSRKNRKRYAAIKRLNCRRYTCGPCA